MIYVHCLNIAYWNNTFIVGRTLLSKDEGVLAVEQSKSSQCFSIGGWSGKHEVKGQKGIQYPLDIATGLRQGGKVRY